jgi:hypothetical protein
MTDLDLAISLFAMEELKERNPSAKRSQTSLPPTASHHGRRRRGGERLACHHWALLSIPVDSKGYQMYIYESLEMTLILASRFFLNRGKKIASSIS